MKKLNQIFFKGLIVVLPIMLTFYLLYWASAKVENLFGSVVLMVVGQEFYWRGTGIVLTVIFIFSVGLLAHNYFTGRIFSWFTGQLEKFPLIKVIYNPLKDLMALIPGRNQEGTNNQRVVMVPMNGVQVMGLVTREGLDELSRSDLVSVYVPFSYMLGGLTLLVPRDQVVKVDMPVDQAIKLSVTAWIKAKDS
jgi:uncharacterized membrane protein